MNPLTPALTGTIRRHQMWFTGLLALLLLLVTVPGMAGVRASIDRNTIYLDDIVTLTIELNGQSSSVSPDLTPLKKDFDVLGTSTSTQISIFNGRRSDKTLWHVQLQAHRRGELHIPPLEVGGQHTRALTLKVSEVPQQSAAHVGQHVFIESEVGAGGKPVYVQQQIPYTVRLYYDDRVQEGDLNAPEPENAVIEDLGEEKRYDSVRNGRSYRVIERNYVISAEKSGDLKIPPARFRGRIAVPRGQGGRRAGSPMDELLASSPFDNAPFFRDRLGGDLFNDPFASASKPVNVHGRAIEITVKPRPAATSNPWLPAEAVTLTDSWTENTPQFKVGEPVKRTITIQAKGLSGSQISELQFTSPPNTRIYPETSEQESRTDGQTIYGIRTQTLTYILNAQGTLDIPPVILKWWNTRIDKAATTTLPAWEFNVQSGAPGTVNPAPPARQPTKQVSGSGTTQSGYDLLTLLREITQTHQRWIIIGGCALIAAILLLFLLARRAKRRQQNKSAMALISEAPTAAQRKRPDQKAALRILEQACAADDPQAASRALICLAEAQWPDNPPRNLGALAARLKNGQSRILELDRNLYGGNNANWKGAALWDVFRHGLPENKTNFQPQEDELKPLYPQHS